MRVRVGLVGGHGRLAEEIDGARDAVLPECAQDAGGVLGRLADDEAMGHVPNAGRGGGAKRGAAEPAAGDAARRATAAGLIVELGQEAGEMGGKVVERPARRHDVDEAEQRRAQLAIACGQLQGSLVGGLERAVRGRGSASCSSRPMRRMSTSRALLAWARERATMGKRYDVLS